MAVTKQARRAMRVSERKQVFNLRRSRAMRTAIKEVSDLVIKGDTKGAQAKLPSAYKAIDKAVKQGIIKKNTAGRKKSGLARKLATK